MARVFSWKVSTGKYAYLFPPYIRNKVVDNDVLDDMANQVRGWDKTTYSEHYAAMRTAVVQVYGPILEEDCTKYWNATDVGASSIALLSGKDGYGSGLGGAEKPAINETDYKKLEEYINSQTKQYHDDLQNQVDRIRQSVSNDVTESVRNALSDINEARTRLNEMESRLSQVGQNALDALDAARKLFELDGADITAEDIINVLSRMGQLEDWLSGNSENLRLIMADFDAAKTRLGEIGIALDASQGLVDFICMGMNVISGTVGTVREKISAISGLVETYVEFVNTASGTVSTIKNLMDANNGVLEDIVEFYRSGGTSSRIGRYICGITASMVDQIDFKDYNGDIRTIYRALEAMSGKVTTVVNMQSGNDISRFEERINLLEGKAERALTISQDNLSSVADLRETWSKASGMLRTVSDLVVKEDEYGPIYYFVGTKGDKKIRVWPMDNGEYNDRYGLNGNITYSSSDPEDIDNGVYYKDHILPEFMTTMLSYIQQASSSITISVTSGTILAALRLQVTDDGSVIFLTADRVVIEADLIAKALSANTANIGGVFIGSGMVYSQQDGHGYWLRPDGVLEADGAIIRGSISATSGYFEGDVIAHSLTLTGSAQQNLNNYIDTKLDDFIASGGVTEAKVNQILMDYLDEAAYLNEDELRAWMTANYSGLTMEEIEEYIRSIMSAQTSTISKVPNSAGGWTVYAHIGDNEYQWDTYNAGDYIILDSVISGYSGNQITKFIVSKEGLLQANNAIIYGKIYASEGYFQGSISATSGYIGNLRYGSASGPTLEDYFNKIVTSAVSGNLDSEVINNLIEDYLEASGFVGYVTEEFFNQWVEEWNRTHSGLTEETVSAIAKSVVNSEISFVTPEPNSAGGVTYVAHIGDKTYEWDTYDTGKWLLLDGWYGTSGFSSGTSGFCVSKQGLLQANNAVVYGKIYASEGWFKGDIYADDGYFNGTINASGGTIGGLTINQYGISGDNINISNFYMGGTVSGDIIARSLVLKGDAQDTINGMIDGKIANLPEGITEDDVNRMLSAAAAASGWTAIDMGDYYKVGTRVVSGTSAFTVSKNGLLVANNAIISGTVFATNGVFNGTIYADNGRFMGEVTGAKISGSTMHAGKIYGSEIYGSKILVDGKRGEYISFYFTVGDDGEGYDAILGNISKELDYDVTFYFEGNPNNLRDFQTFTVSIEHGRTYGVCLLDGREEQPARIDDMYGGNVITDYMGIENVTSYTGNISDIDIVLNTGRSTVPQEYLSIPSNLNGKVIYSPKFSTSASTQYFEVLQNGQMTANNAIINGDITMNSGNSIVMYNSGGQPSFLLSSDKVSIDNVSTTYSLKERTLYSNAYGIYDSNRGYAGYDDDGFQSTIWCSITKRAGDQFTTYPSITINVSRNYRGGSGYARGEVRVLWNNYVVSAITVSTNELTYNYNSTSKTLYLQNILSSKQGSSGTLLITYEGETMATANAPSMQGEDTYGRGTVTFSASQGITVQSSTGSTDTRFFVGSNGIQMRLDGGSNLTFGIIDGHPRFHCELRESGAIVGGIDIDGTNGVRYWPKNGSQYKELT